MASWPDRSTAASHGMSHGTVPATPQRRLAVQEVVQHVTPVEEEADGVHHQDAARQARPRPQDCGEKCGAHGVRNERCSRSSLGPQQGPLPLSIGIPVPRRAASCTGGVRRGG
eukprot:scaffold6711_cov118-Isochrysis_galbana.AAC.38